MNPSLEECAICLEGLRARDGKALFIAECSHTFHFNCITRNVRHGNHVCPTCRCKWSTLPSHFFSPTPPPPPPPPLPNFNPRRQPTEEMISATQAPLVVAPLCPPPPPPPPPRLPNFNLRQHFRCEDDALPSLQPNTSQTPDVHSEQAGRMILTALPELPALSKSEQADLFPVLIGIRAPALSPEASDRPGARAPLDLVAVLDVSTSMNGEKMRLLKLAMGFVVDNLGPTDRLSVITFSDTARRVTSLRLMADEGQSHTIRAVNSLQASGTTNIIAGLKMAVQVLDHRRQKNPVASIILLSDGQDDLCYGTRFLNSLRRLPPCIRVNATNQDPLSSTVSDVVPVPVHTFGFGSDHDATALHAIADGSGGTFSYIESIEIIQDAFARCIGGLLSVVAQQVEIHLQSGVPAGVQIRSISSGRYRNTVDNDANPNGIVHVGDVYAEEEKKFLVNLSVAQETDLSSTKLLEVKCSYKDSISNENVITETVTVEIRRPTTENLSEADRQVCVEVDRERNRISIAEGIAEAQTMAERGELDRARNILQQRRDKMMSSSSAQAGDKYSRMLDSEVRTIHSMWGSYVEYEGGGKAYACSKRNAHMYQRASTQAMSLSSAQWFSCPIPSSDSAPYQTSVMLKMVQKSMELRQGGDHGEHSGRSNNSDQP